MSAHTKKFPTVSVMMPVRNEARYLEEGLNAILSQTYPAELIEVVVVDGDSEDGTADVAQRAASLFRERGFKSYLVSMNPAGSTPSSLNLALERCSGNIVMRIDGHSRVGPDHVARCVDLLEETGADNVGGGIDALGRTASGEAIALANTSPFGVGGSTFRHGRSAGWVQTAYPGAFKRDVFERLGGFDEELVRNQDDEFNLRLVQTGGKIWFDPHLRTEHYARESLKAHFKQHFEFGLYKVRVMQKRRTVPAARHLVPAAFVSAVMVAGGLYLVTRRPLYPIIVGTPYLAAASGAACHAARHKPSLIPRVLAAFLLMHLGYGLGTLAGVFRWRKHFRRVGT